MLEKYRKLAHDASLNGDRVLTEYYLQFADHYFRVVADSRTQKDEVRPRDEHDRDQPFGSDDYEAESRDEQSRGRGDRYEDDRADGEEGQRASEREEAVEAAAGDNPFVRDTRPPRERSGQRSRSRPANDASEEPADSGFDAAVLPPSIPREEEEAPRPAPRGRGRRSRPADDGDEEALEAVS